MSESNMHEQEAPQEGTTEAKNWSNFFVPFTYSSLDMGHIASETLEKVLEMHSGKEAHHGIFDLESRPSFKDYRGLARPALGMVFVDFDSEFDRGASALSDVRKFIQTYGLTDLALFFSGCKGFVLGIPEGYFGLAPSEDLPERLKYFASILKSDFPTLDVGIYGANHKLRAYGTQHPKSKLFKIQLVDEFKIGIINGTITLEEIRNAASNERGCLNLRHLDLSKKRTPLTQFTNILEKYQKNSCGGSEGAFSSEAEDRVYIVDEDGVKNGCEVLKFAKQKPNEVSEALWYAILSVVGRFSKGREEAHEFSKNYMGYSVEDTDKKLDQALNGSKPRTCKSISVIADGLCSKCEYNGKVNSPISIRGPNFIRTERTGFHNTSDSGKMIPCHEDLLKFFDLGHRHVTLVPGRICFRFNGKFYEPMSDAELESFAQDHFRPFAKTCMTKEFSNLVMRRFQKRSAWFEETSLRKINFLNGMLDIDSMKFSHGHSPEYGFRSVLNFNYEPTANCPKFNKFMADITCGDKTLEANLLEFSGYAISNDHCDADKIMVMTGEGSNGKTRLLNIQRELGGKGCISLGPNEFRNSFKRQLLDGALFCVIEELPPFKDVAFWEDMKGLASGKAVTADKKHKDPYEFINKTKIIIVCNELPPGTSPTHGYFRKLNIIPFNQTFSAEKGNRIENIDRLIIANEMPGVFNRVLEAYHRLRKQNYVFTKSQAVDEALKSYKSEVDSVYRWFEQHAHILPEGEKIKLPLPNGMIWIVKGPYDEYVAHVPLMYGVYSEWCKNENENPVTSTQFTRRLKKLIPDADSRLKDRKIGGVKVNTISGVSFYRDEQF